jgi:hypothetical protein
LHELDAKALLVATLASLASRRRNFRRFPSRPLRHCSLCGGRTEHRVARLAAEALGRVLDKPVIVENRGGGGGLNATEAYLGIEPNGYTILVGSIGPFTIIPAAKHVSYDVEQDFIPLGTVWRSAQLLAARRTLGVASVAGFVAYAKAHPGKVTIGSAGVGAVTHLAIELLKRGLQRRRDPTSRSAARADSAGPDGRPDRLRCSAMPRSSRRRCVPATSRRSRSRRPRAPRAPGPDHGRGGTRA